MFNSGHHPMHHAWEVERLRPQNRLGMVVVGWNGLAGGEHCGAKGKLYQTRRSSGNPMISLPSE